MENDTGRSDVVSPAGSSATFRTTVKPRHCDAQGALHAIRYYEYFEDAFLYWLDTHIGRTSLSTGYTALRESGTDLVVVSSRCDHHRGIGLGAALHIQVQPVAAGRTSLEVMFTIRSDTGEPMATGHITYVATSSDQGTTPLPDLLRALTPESGRPRRSKRAMTRPSGSTSTEPTHLPPGRSSGWRLSPGIVILDYRVHS